MRCVAFGLLAAVLAASAARADSTDDQFAELNGVVIHEQQLAGPSRCLGQGGTTLLGVQSDAVVGMGTRGLNPNNPENAAVIQQYEQIRSNLLAAAQTNPPVPNQTLFDVFVRRFPDVAIASAEASMAALQTVRAELTSDLNRYAGQPSMLNWINGRLADTQASYDRARAERDRQQQIKDSMDLQDQRYMAAIAPFRAQLQALNQAADGICGTTP